MRLHRPRPVQENPLKLEEVASPSPGPGQLLLRVAACGLCHTDLHTVEGDLELPRLPVTPGHQVVATVVEAGPDTRHFRPGERVGVGWLYRTCGACAFCRSGLENLCPAAAFTGLHADGGYAQAMVVDEEYAYHLPAAFSDVEAAPLLCAGIIGFRSLRLSQVRPGDALGLYGFGASAHLVVQVARHWECDVYVFTRSPQHQRLARELGAVWAGRAEEASPVALDGGVLFAPAGWIVPLALGHLRPGGTLAINAIHLSPIPEMPYARLYGERVLRSVANYTRQDARDFLALAAEIPIRTQVEAFELAQANDVLQMLKRSEIKAAAAFRIPPQ
jgi:propanol-preferring alcohol dehydrogenase